MKDDQRTYLVYVRKSEERDERQALSIPAQLEECRKVVEREGLKVKKIYKETKSAKRPGRPVFDEMVDRLESGKANAILCWHINRLSRNGKDSGNLQWLMDDHDVIIKTPDRRYDVKNSSMMFKFETGQAEQYSKDLSAAVRRGNRAYFERGHWLGLPPPGYLNMSDPVDSEKKSIVKDPIRFPLIRRAWDLLLTDTYAVTEIVRIANEEWGYRTPKRKRIGDKPLKDSVLYRVFRNPFYYGLMRRKVDGEQMEQMGLHEPMITKKEFDKAQAILGHDSKFHAPAEDFDGLNAGLITCGECGGAITYEKHWKRYKNGKKQLFVYARCTKRKVRTACSQPYLPLAKLNEQIEAELQQLTMSPKFTQWALKELKRANETELKHQQTTRKSLQTSFNATQLKLDRLLEVYLNDPEVVSKEEYLKRKQVLELERDKSKERLDDLEYRTNTWFERAEEAFEFSMTVLNQWQTGDARKKRSILLRIAGSNLVLKDRKLTIKPVAFFDVIQKHHETIVAFSNGGPGRDRVELRSLLAHFRIALAIKPIS